MDVQVIISNPDGSMLYQPAVEEGIQINWQRRSSPGKMTCSVINDGNLPITEGWPIRMTVDGANAFYGFIFTQKRDRDQIIDLTCYDQLRYLNNKDTYVETNKTASQMIQMIAADFGLQTGDIEATPYVIPSISEDNQSLFDIIESALDQELLNTKNMYIMYDDFGKITLKSLANMYVKDDQNNYLMIDEETGENYDYQTSIDKDVYNQIKLTYENKDTGKRDVWIAKDSAHINEWGTLQYYDTLKEGENGQSKADSYLSVYNKKVRTLKISGAFGDIRVRGGSLLVVNLNLGDGTQVKNFMMVEKVTHKFDLDHHTMDLTLRGGDFDA